MTPDIILQRTGIDVRAIEQGDDAWPVSYTHLDVYKRQPASSAHLISTDKTPHPDTGLASGNTRKPYQPAR